jgi:hypothetical protein
MSRWKHWQVELAIVLSVFIASTLWGTQFWNDWVARGGQPVFYQAYFEPAVMVACGRGFVITRHQPKPLEDFLFLRADRFDCSTLPRQLDLDPDHVYQAPWLYLETTVGVAWKVLGISWSGMGPLFGMFFAAVVTLAYGISRIAVNRVLALLVSFALAVSSIHLDNLPHLRDYSKAPFTLALVFILGLIVTRPPRAKSLLALSAAYGAVLGVGYGFRSDFLAALPVLVIVLFAFLDGGVFKNLALKAGASAAFLATFAIVSLPITTAVYEKGGCQWHVALLGLQSPLDDGLGVRPAAYDFGHAYSDEYISRTVSGYAFRMNPNSAPLVFCSHDYDVQSGSLLQSIVAAFPGDLLTRAAGSVLQIVELPFRQWTAPMADWWPFLYRARAVALQPGVRWGTYFTLAAIAITAAVSVRLALFLTFFVAYFGGYPAVQFQERHFFHLEFIGWWAMAFVAYQGGRAVLHWQSPPSREVLVRGAATAAIVLMAMTAVAASTLWVGRVYQERAARRLFETYIAAPKIPIDSPGAALIGIADRAWPQLVDVQLSEAECGPTPTVTFQYAAEPLSADFHRTIRLDGAARAGTTHVFVPVFDRYTGVSVSSPAPGCLVGVSRVRDLTSFPLLLGAVLRPGWQTQPLHQRLAYWEGEKSEAAR